MAVEHWLRLALAPEIGPVLAHRLLAAVGGRPEAVFAAPREVLVAVPGLHEGRLAGLLDGGATRAARDEIARAEALGLVLIALDDARYPALLRRLPHPPLVLWVRGRLDPADVLAVAIVGPRNPSGYARLMADAIARPLAARGLTLVSGMAYGIDGDVHRAALEAGGRTVGVVGQGLGTPLSPQAHADLARRIVDEDRGALVSIFPSSVEPRAGLYPARNEIIAGLALGVLVVEASPTSGALITARHALGAGRQVMACPGDATRRAAQGSNRLIAEGAPLVQSADDVLAVLEPDLRREMEVLGPLGAPSAGPTTPPPADAPRPARPVPRRHDDALGTLMQELLAEQPLPADAILERCTDAGHSLSAVLERLLQWELDGRLRQLPGRLYALAQGAPASCRRSERPAGGQPEGPDGLDEP